MARPRSASAHRHVLAATLALFAERGIDRTSVDAIARASGVSKATIYKHWPDKDALALEALAGLFGLDEPDPTFDSGDWRQDFVDALTWQPASRRRDLRNRLLPHVMAYAARHHAFGHRWRTRVIGQPERRLETLIARGIAARRLRPDLEKKPALALLLGPMLYWQIFVGRKAAAPVPRDLATEVVEAFVRAYGVRPRRARLASRTAES